MSHGGYNKFDTYFDEKGIFEMRKRIFRHRVLLSIAACLLIAASVTAIVYFATRNKERGTLAEASVVRASLSSSLSSAGQISTVSTKVTLPLAALTLENPEKLSEIEKNDYTVNLLTLFGENAEEPILWRVLELNEDYHKKTVTLSTADTSEEILTLAPVSFDWEAVTEAYEAEVTLGTTDAENAREYVLSLLLRDGGSSLDPAKFPDDFWKTYADAAVTVTTERIADMLLREMSYLDELSYKISSLTWNEGDILILDNDVFTVSYEEKFVSLVLSEYDVAGIDARMRRGERVYAAVSVNPLSGRELIAEIVKIGGTSTSSGVTYFTLMARLVFPEITERADGTEKGDYTYYDPYLTDETVHYLGIDLTDNLRREELLAYSVTVTVQKTVVNDSLIVPTKCIYYDDDKKPYVVVLDADKKEKRVYIKITLSTGTDAAVTAADGYTLNEGDVLRYTAESSLIGSLF